MQDDDYSSTARPRAVCATEQQLHWVLFRSGATMPKRLIPSRDQMKLSMLRSGAFYARGLWTIIYYCLDTPCSFRSSSPSPQSERTNIPTNTSEPVLQSSQSLPAISSALKQVSQNNSIRPHDIKHTHTNTANKPRKHTNHNVLPSRRTLRRLPLRLLCPRR